LPRLRGRAERRVPEVWRAGVCGKPLLRHVRAAAREGQTVPEREPRSYTPPHLVEKILSSRSALVGERKLVTVLFADVKGSMDLSELIDAEDWHRIMNRFFEILTDGVRRFEGTVNQESMRSALAHTAIAEQTGSVFARVISTTALARSHLLAGRCDEARIVGEQSLAMARGSRVWLEAEGEMLSLLAEQAGARVALPWVCVLESRLAGLHNDEAARTGKLREAHRLFAAMGAPGYAARVAKELGS
jgi:class 3 adenylate cyclase